MVKSNEEALRELLRLMADNPGLADRITITIKPAKVLQGTDKKDSIGRGAAATAPFLRRV